MQALTGSMEEPTATQAEDLQRVRRNMLGLAALREVAERMEELSSSDVRMQAGPNYFPQLIQMGLGRKWLEGTDRTVTGRNAAGVNKGPIRVYRSRLYTPKE